MPCPSCAADNPPGSRFCNQCAAPLVRAAIGPTPDRAGYTPRHLVEKVLRHRSALVGERKRVTVLFADIKGSTRLAGQAGAEAWHAILDRFFSLLAQAVHRYEGTVNQYTGDGVMALFGAPVAHEDHALRACHAALDMQAAIRAFADELRLQRALNLTLRIGLNTGEVVVGRIGDDLRMDYTAQGATVNLAARLEQICEPGQVYLSRATAMQIQDRFLLRGLGAMQVDGIDQAVQVFALESYDRVAAKAPRRLSGGAAGLHGRQAELAQLRALLDEVGQGRGRVVGMVGTAGIGKSRLCHELLVEARQRGIATHRTTASPYARQLSMAAPRDLYLSRIGCPPDADAEDIRACIEAELPGSLRSRPGALGFVMEFAGVGRPGELTEAQAASLRQPMMRQLAQYLSRADSPQVLLFEDLQHLDALTLEFVRLLAAAVAATPTLLLLSWRADAARMDLPGLHQTLQLPPLAPEASSRLAAAWLGPHRSLAGLAARIAERADGNPYFVEEAVIALAETGHLTGTQGAYRLQLPIAQLPIPDTVHALVAARIDRLPPPQKAWLQRAAVIGPDFDTDLLAELSDDRADPRPALAALEQSGLLQREGDVWRFAQPLLREVAYDAQLRASRVALHAQLAAAMEARSAGQSTQAVARSVAAHWALARQWLAAARWNLEAARWYSARDPHISVEQFRQAALHLDRADDDTQVRRLRITAWAGLLRMANFVSLDSTELDQAYAQAAQLAQTLDDAQAAAELDISYSNLRLLRGDAEHAVQLVESALARAPVDIRAQLADRFRLPILLAYGSLGRFRQGIDVVNACCGTDWWEGPINADNSGSRGYLVLHLGWSGRLPQARRDLACAIELIERDGRSSSWMHGLRVELAWLSGDLRDVLEEADRAVEQAVAFRSLYFDALASRARGQALLMTGDAAGAVRVLQDGLPLVARGTGAYPFQPYHLAVLSEALGSLGRHEEAAAHSLAAVRAAAGIGVRMWELRAWIARLASPAAVLSADFAAAGFARARALLVEMDASGVAPRLAELEALRDADPGSRRPKLLEAAAAYEKIGAADHAQRVRAAAQQRLDRPP